MRVSIHGMIRLLGLLGAVACAGAITMARLEPKPLRLRLAMPPAFGVINGFVIDQNFTESRLLDVEQGVVGRLKLPTFDRLDYGSFSPWSNEEGEFQLVGRWEHRSQPGPGGRSLGFGLARYSLPEGRVLDEIVTEISPASHPCWFPDWTARVVYSGGDGQLYRLDFDGPAARGETPAPESIAWRTTPPGPGVIIRDPVWPTSPKLEGRLIVSLVHRIGTELTAARLWWLRLDRDGRSIVEAAPLTSQDGPDLFADEARFPNVAETPDGRLWLAWLAHPDASWRWEVRLAPLQTDAATHVPTVDPKTIRVLSREALPSLTPFSHDGRFLHAVVGNPRTFTAGKVVRFPTDPETPPAEAQAAASDPH